MRMAEPRNKFLVSSFWFQVTNCEARNMEIFSKPDADSWGAEVANFSRLKLETRNLDYPITVVCSGLIL